MLPNLFNALAKGWKVRDGSPVSRDLNQFLVGQEIVSVQAGALTEEGYSVTRMLFHSGDQLLVIPAKVDPEVRREAGIELVTHFIFQKAKARKIWIPGQN